jgi:hypothetical protein
MAVSSFATVPLPAPGAPKRISFMVFSCFFECVPATDEMGAAMKWNFAGMVLVSAR